MRRGKLEKTARMDRQGRTALLEMRVLRVHEEGWVLQGTLEVWVHMGLPVISVHKESLGLQVKKERWAHRAHRVRKGTLARQGQTARKENEENEVSRAC